MKRTARERRGEEKTQICVEGEKEVSVLAKANMRNFQRIVRGFRCRELLKFRRSSPMIHAPRQVHAFSSFCYNGGGEAGVAAPPAAAAGPGMNESGKAPFFKRRFCLFTLAIRPASLRPDVRCSNNQNLIAKLWQMYQNRKPVMLLCTLYNMGKHRDA